MSVFRRRITKGFSKKKFILDKNICKICKSDRGMNFEAMICYKCLFNGVREQTKFKC